MRHRGKKDVLTTVRFPRRTIKQMDFDAKRLNLSRNELLERAYDFAIANFDYFQLALLKLKDAEKKLDSAETDDEFVKAFLGLSKAMKIDLISKETK